MEAVNLLPLEYRDRKRKRAGAADLSGRRTLQLGGAAALVFALLFAALYVHERSVVNSKKTALANDQARIAAVQPQIEAIKTAKAAVAAKLATAQSVTGARMNWDRALTDFAKVIPTSAYLTSLQVSAPVATAAAATTTTPSTDGTAASAPPPTAPSGMTLNGVASSTPGVALVMDKLGLLPWLNGVTLTSASLQPDNTYNFVLTAGVSEEH